MPAAHPHLSESAARARPRSSRERPRDSTRFDGANPRYIQIFLWLKIAARISLMIRAPSLHKSSRFRPQTLRPRQTAVLVVIDAVRRAIARGIVLNHRQLSIAIGLYGFGLAVVIVVANHPRQFAMVVLLHQIDAAVVVAILFDLDQRPVDIHFDQIDFAVGVGVESVFRFGSADSVDPLVDSAVVIAIVSRDWGRAARTAEERDYEADAEQRETR